MVHFSTFPFSTAVIRTLLPVLLLAFRLPVSAQAPAWQSVRAVAVATAAAANPFSQVTATAVDAAGNVYLAGNFQSSVVLGGTTLTSLGRDEVFVTKFSPATNQFVWAQRAGGAGYDQATALAVSGTSVYVAGRFDSPTADFGPTTLANAAGGGFNAFVAKLTDAGPTGSFVWAQGVGDIGNDAAAALALSGPSVYVAGTASGPTAFGPVTLAASGVFVAKLTDAGNTGDFVWAQGSVGSGGNDYATALAARGTSVYVAGTFGSRTVRFGTTTLLNAGTTSMASGDAFVAKLTDAGNTGSFGWAQGVGSTGQDDASALAVNGTSVYMTGGYGGPTAFGPVTLAAYGVFVAKLTDAGNTGGFVWAQRAGVGTGLGYIGTSALAVSGPSVYVAGSFANATASFGATTLTNGHFDGITPELFVAKLTDAGPTGSFGWAQGAGGPGQDVAYALALSGPNVYVTGFFKGPTASFGSIVLTNPTPNKPLGYLATLTDPTLTATAAGRAPAPAQLFPNPAGHAATLRLPPGAAPAPLVLTDALGRAVRRYPAPAGPEVALDLRGLPAGLYLLRGAGPAQRLVVE